MGCQLPILVVLGTLLVGCGATGLFRVDASKSKHEFLRAGLQERGWRELKKRGSSVQAGFVWTFRWTSPDNERQLINHFANYNALCTKASLLASLAGRDTSAWAPRGYPWPRDAALLAADFHRTAAVCAGEETSEATAELPALQPSIDCGGARGRAWIAKPAAGTRGVGIEVFRDLQLMEEWLQSQSRPSAEEPAQFVVQKYVETPMLLFGRKFDLRLFALVVSLQPLVVFCSTDTYVRFASAPFDCAASSPFAHLTNAQVQKYAPPNATQDVEDAARGIVQNQWSLDSFRAHLAASYGEGAWERVVAPKLRQMVAEVASAWPQRAQHHRAASFELLGLDVMLSAGLEPWLLEVNADPGLHVLTPVVEAHHRRAVGGLLAAVLERRGEWNAQPSCRLEQCDLQIGPWQLVLKE
jgi:hypothetical protein